MSSLLRDIYPYRTVRAERAAVSILDSRSYCTLKMSITDRVLTLYISVNSELRIRHKFSWCIGSPGSIERMLYYSWQFCPIIFRPHPLTIISETNLPHSISHCDINWDMMPESVRSIKESDFYILNKYKTHIYEPIQNNSKCRRFGAPNWW